MASRTRRVSQPAGIRANNGPPCRPSVVMEGRPLGDSSWGTMHRIAQPATSEPIAESDACGARVPQVRRWRLGWWQHHPGAISKELSLNDLQPIVDGENCDLRMPFIHTSAACRRRRLVVFATAAFAAAPVPQPLRAAVAFRAEPANPPPSGPSGSNTRTAVGRLPGNGADIRRRPLIA